MSPLKPTLDGSEDMSANDTSVSTEVHLDEVNTAYPNTALGMNEMSASYRGCMINCTL